MNDGHALASTLEPALREACRGRLSPVRWFHATWQHGGAGTGYAEWTPARGKPIECVVKLPVSYREYAWTKRLGLVREDEWDGPEALNLPTPRVLAGGFELGAYDFAWLVMEKFPGSPLGVHKMEGLDVWAVFETAAEFHAAAILEQPVEPDRCPNDHDWTALIGRALRQIDTGCIEQPARWNKALHRAREALPDLLARWRARPVDTWCHRDVHAHNAMRRGGRGGAKGRVALIDLARVAPGCWVEDAMYLERMCWGREGVLCGVDPVRTLAQTRRGIGLPADDEDFVYADLRRVLMAATSPAFSRTEGDSVYLGAALERLEGLLPAVCG